MKKYALVLVFLFHASLYAAEDTPGAPKTVTGTSMAGISISAGAGSMAVSKSSFSVSGLSFRSLDAEKKGFEIPFSLSINNNNEFFSSGKRFLVSAGISSGYRFINPVFMNEYIRVNVCPGIMAGYSFEFTRTEYTYTVPVNTYLHSVSLTLSGTLEIEVPIGRIFSLPPDTICLASGVSVNAGGTGMISIPGSSSASGLLRFFVNTGSFGNNLTALAVRYYF